MYSCNIQQVNRGLDLLDEHFQIVVLKIGWKFPEPVIGESIIFLEFIKNDTFCPLEFHLCWKEIQQ